MSEMSLVPVPMCVSPPPERRNRPEPASRFRCDSRRSSLAARVCLEQETQSLDRPVLTNPNCAVALAEYGRYFLVCQSRQAEIDQITLVVRQLRHYSLDLPSRFASQ